MIRSNPSTGTRTILATCAIGCLLLPATMNAQIDRSRPPEPGPAPIVNLGAHSTTELSNGMKVIVVEDHKLPLVSVQLRFDVPPIAQREKAGYIDMIGDMMLAGTTTRTKAQIDLAVDAIGATFQASNSGVYGSVLKKHLTPLLDLMQDVVINPTFPKEELERMRKLSISGVQQRQEDPDAIGEVVGRSVTFGSTHPYGEVTTIKSLAEVSTKSMQAYHNYFLRPEKGYLVFVGDITEKEAKDVAKDLFGKWKPAAVPVSVDENGIKSVDGIGPLYLLDKPSIPVGVRRVFLVDRPGAAQSVIRVAFPLNLLPKDIRGQQAQVMNTILGGGVFNARLMQNLREKRAFTYGAYSTLDVDRYNSSLTVSVSVRTAVTDSAVQEIINELEQMRNEPVTAEELDLAKQYMMGSFGRSLEDPRTVARFALNTELNDMPADYYTTYLKRLESVTAEQVQDAALAFLHPDQAVILVVGDKDETMDLLAPFSKQNNTPVIQLDVDGGRWMEELEKVEDRVPEQVIESYIHAIGGRDPIASIRQLKLVWTIGDPANELTRTEWIGPEQYRTELKKGAASLETIIYDGKRAQIITPEGGGELTDAALEAIKSNTLPVPEIAYDKLMDRRLLPGSTMLNGKKVFKLYLVDMGGIAFSVYFDAETGMKVRRVEDKLIYGRSYAVTTDFLDWRSVNGVQMPHSLSEKGGPDGRVISTLTKVEVNKPYPPGFFDVNIPEVPDAPAEPDWIPPADE
ncbi:MAG TPA: pitrilysin family protein [Flavobacteriales bacterium]|nr:pitrilysin family protein [Flavobacteriales bacterium]